MNFNDMFFKDVDENERAYNITDTINVRFVHHLNWDCFMEQAVVYGFIQFWESYGEDSYERYKKSKDPNIRQHKYGHIGLKLCYDRIMNEPEKFFGDIVALSLVDSYFVTRTIEFVWKYRWLMWN